MAALTQTNLPFRDSAALNMATFMDYFSRLKALAVTMFDWQGLPNMISVRYLEDVLFNYGLAAFINDDLYGPMITRVTAAGKLNFYNEPVRYNVYATGGYNKMLDAENVAIIRNNYLMRPTADTINLYAQRLYEVERAIDVNVKNQKLPLIIKGTEQQKLSLNNILMKIDGNQPFVIVDKNLDPGIFQVFPTNSPYVADKLMMYKHDLWNEAMTFLGVANANTDKRERLISDEVNANNQLVQMGAAVMLSTRESACEKINQLFGLSVSVKLREMAQKKPEQSDKGGKGHE